MNLPDFQLPVPANPPDAGTVIAVQFGQDWIPALLTVLELMRSENFFLSAPSDIQEQIDELNDRLQNPVIISPQVYPAEIWHPHNLSGVVVGGALTAVINTGEMFNGHYAQATPARLDETGFWASLDSGNYHLQWFGLKQASNGIVTVTTDEGSTTTIDLYAATTQLNQFMQVTIAVTTPGNHWISLKMNTKNASSTGYAAPTQGYALAKA